MITRRPLALAPLVFPLALAGCHSLGTDLDAPTTLEFQGMTPQDASHVEAVLRGQGLSVARKDGPTGTTFTTDGIDSTRKLAEVHGALMDAAKDDHIEMKFEGTTLRYSSLTATGTSLTTVTIQASPGAVAYVADQEGGTPWRLIQLDRSGKWQGSVRTRGPVTANGGWLYVAVTRDEALYRYLKVNVLTNEPQVTTFAQLQQAGLGQPPVRAKGASGTPSSTSTAGPKPPATKPADGTSSGAKWPWQK